MASFSILSDFSCSCGTRYNGCDKNWVKKGEDKLDIEKILGDDDSLKSFTEDMKTLKPKSWPSHIIKDSAAVNCPKMPLRSKHSVVHDGYTYVMVGGDSEGISEAKRAVFIPSLGRYKLPLFDWPDDLKSKIVVFVAWYELMLYEEWRTNNHVMFLTVIPHVDDVECIGFARHHIFKFAQNIGRQYLWMIDDSVPVDQLQEGIIDLKEEKITSKPVGLSVVFEEVEAKMVEEKVCLLMGINTTNAITYTKSTTLHQNRYLRNERTPTSMVYVFCGEFNDDTYCPNFYLADLPCREDVLCAAQIIKFGNEVIIDRKYHFVDKPIAVGGAQQFFVT